MTGRWAAVGADDDELRGTLVPGFFCKVTAHGRKAFTLQYRTTGGERRRPKIGQFGELTVENARAVAQGWLADVHECNDPSAAQLAERMASTAKALCGQLIEKYAKPRTVERDERFIDRHVVPAPGKLKLPDVTRARVATLMRDTARIAATANRLPACLRKMLNLAEVRDYAPHRLLPDWLLARRDGFSFRNPNFMSTVA
ncbi:Arm DNA-binding domain-containing protein [Burkholderia sp. IMCC1007]|uniref:Arm DNA-binding domain-containing protein n=1 Tax=Burkholderia sp. IMCC1007 TaxID=3004104 RepID=UPI0022B50264|nr:Arm DNA-binding domain-containing protein [Burkholderia sp. IMCC1007]